MDVWQGSLHWSFSNEQVLIPYIRLDSFYAFLLGSLLTIIVCLLERLTTFVSEKHWVPFASIRRSRLKSALWRSVLYWIAVFLRLLYMLIAMTFHVGLLLVIATTLAICQFAVELHNAPLSRSNDGSYTLIEQPALHDQPYSQPVITRPRSKSKPDNKFIHPNHSNLARADAVALELGLSGDTDRVVGNIYPGDTDTWELGKGRDIARSLLGTSGRRDSQTSFQDW